MGIWTLKVAVSWVGFEQHPHREMHTACVCFQSRLNNVCLNRSLNMSNVVGPLRGAGQSHFDMDFKLFMDLGAFALLSP